MVTMDDALEAVGVGDDVPLMLVQADPATPPD